MFNQSYQNRANRDRMVPIKEIIAELVIQAREREKFYRPYRRPVPGVAAKDCKKSHGKLQGVQLELFTSDSAPTVAAAKREVDPDRPLADLFPEAYSR